MSCQCCRLCLMRSLGLAVTSHACWLVPSPGLTLIHIVVDSPTSFSRYIEERAAVRSRSSRLPVSPELPHEVEYLPCGRPSLGAHEKRVLADEEYTRVSGMP